MMPGPDVAGSRNTRYVVLVCGADGVVLSSLPLRGGTDDEALVAAQRVLDPGQMGEVWTDNRLVGRISHNA
jgi:hypothetical protein